MVRVALVVLVFAVLAAVTFALAGDPGRASIDWLGWRIGRRRRGGGFGDGGDRRQGGAGRGFELGAQGRRRARGRGSRRRSGGRRRLGRMGRREQARAEEGDERPDHDAQEAEHDAHPERGAEQAPGLLRRPRRRKGRV